MKWNELTEEVTAPFDVMVALSSGRSEMLKLRSGGAANAEETAQLYNVIRVLMDTNRALQDHAQSMATETENLRLCLRGINRKLDDLHTLAKVYKG